MKRLRDKLYNWEENSPTHVWDRVRAALDESESSAHFPNKLREYEVAPPASAWSAVAAGLDAEVAETEPAAPVVTIRRARVQWMRYAAAIVILAFVGFGIRFLTMDKETSLAEVPAVPTTQATAKAPEEKQTNNLPPLGEHAKNDSLRTELAAVPNPTRRYSANDNLQFASEANLEYARELENNIYFEEVYQPRIAEKYVTLITPEGSFIRMSKKWSDLLCCIAGEDPNAACNIQLKAWQDQLAESPVTPAPGSFMDILDLVNSVSEGTQL
ncbi:MAG: hypothetical protein NVV59_14560 [Chitinophagaceae bacterium]|nr:hypothetical protein [Chitinophagaceae bacterium]